MIRSERSMGAKGNCLTSEPFIVRTNLSALGSEA